MAYGRKKRILLVEDEMLIAMLKQNELENYNYEVTVINRGEAAVEYVRNNDDLDLILMDINLGPGIDGSQAAKQILTEKDIPVIFHSSHTEPEIVEITEKISSYGYVVKDSSITVLDACIKMAFKLHEATMKLEEHRNQLQSANEKLKSSNTELERVNSELYKYEEDLKASQHIARLGSWRLDVATNRVTWTEELYRMYGFDPEMPPPPYNEQMEIFTPESWVLLSDSLDRTVKTGEPYELELEMARDGKPIGWMWVRGEAVKDETGKTVELRGAAQDITERKNLEQSLRRSEEFLNRTGEMARVGGWEVDLKTEKVSWTRATRIIHEVPMDHEPALNEALSYFPGKSGELLAEAFERAARDGESYDLELDFISAKGKKLKVRTIGQAECVNGICKRVYGIFQDITLRKEYDKQKELYETRYRVLTELHGMFNSSKEDLFDFIIEASKRVTESEFSFFGTLSDDEDEMTIHTWSRNVMDSCMISDQPKNFPIAQSGIWGDCVRQRKTVIYNDYSRNIPSKHGTPEGHVPIFRFMGIPVFEGNRIVAIGAVANKADPYDEHDSNAVSTLYARLWDIVMRNNAEASLRNIEWLLENTVSSEVPSGKITQYYGDLTRHNSDRTIIDSIKPELLASIAGDTIDLLGTSVAVYEKNGDYAYGMFTSGWCRLMDSASRKLCNTDDNVQALACGKWLCHESCWNDAAKKAIVTGEPADIECVGGIHLYAEPIFAENKVIGSVNIGYGDPPRDDETQRLLAEKYQVDISEIKKAVSQYRSRPPYLVDIAKKRLKSSAQLIGKQVESKIIAERLKERIKELGCLQKFSQIVERSTTIDEILAELVYLIRDAMSFPAQTEVRITLNGKSHKTGNFYDVTEIITAAIIENNISAGRIEIVNTDTDKEKIPFLEEERKLISLIAERTGHISERLSMKGKWSNLLEMINEAVIFADKDGFIDSANQAAADLCGYSSLDDLLGVPMTSIYAEPETRNSIIKLLENEGGQLKNLEFQLLRKDGSTVPTLCNVRLIKDCDGKIAGTLGALRDISELKKIQDDLFIKDWAVESSSNALAMAGLDGVLSYVNRAFLTMWEYENKAEVLGRNAVEFWSDEDNAEKVVYELQKKSRWKGEMNAVKKDGTSFVVSVSASIVLNRKNEPECMFAAFENITELVKTRHQLEAAVEEKQTLLQELKHRIKNSFAIIQGMLQLNACRIDDKATASVLNDIRSRVTTIGELYSLLHETEISGSLRLDIYCSRIIQSLQAAYATESRGIVFDADCEPVETTVKEASVIGMIINEVLTNSLKYAFPDGKTGSITVSLKKSGDLLVLDICDNGVGLPKGFTLEQNAGFGLQLLQGMIKQLEGTMTVLCDGTGFNIRIPC